MANSYDEVSIYKLPPEIYYSVFDLLVSEDLYELESGPALKKPIASFAISQVSQRWRAIALDLPQIWTSIRIFHFCNSQREMVKELITRSKDLPLDFVLEYDRSLERTETRNFWEILLTIMAHSLRWRSLRIVANEILFVQICSNFSGGREAPILQRLELVVLPGPIYSSHVYHPDFLHVPPLSLEFHQIPQLKHLILHGIHLKTRSPAYMQQLETLDIDSLPAMDMLGRPPLPADSPPFSTRLRTLAVTNLGILDLSRRSFLSEYTAFLTSLSLSNINGRSLLDVSRLFRHLPSSTLRELSISNVDLSFWNGLLNSMALIPRYPAVQKLLLANVEAWTEMPDHFTAGFPNLEKLSLFSLPTLLTNKFTSEVIFPKLQTLCTREIPYQTLCDVVDFRIASKLPLTSLEVDSPPLPHFPSLSYLRRKVPRFKRVTDTV
ncbi:hypothetical protein GYMLUDRAFT_49518 [Collybiopsis luxurians FD-317 M1]|uniref:F-box domain-containing protein n=1 Tax=Collybiopsis luxurians FD-317 M1 TaxID=944289 RepID=A0A0D0AS05_9AGAR|nr:hypothetical protein GYMLUDRAFT_49518 [Collybiopsis luxurians FD-317 M1]